MTLDNWRLVIGNQQIREWSNNQYIFKIGKEQQEADPVFRELQSNTPLRYLVQQAVDDSIVRAITFLSYYHINPTFRQTGQEVGANFFWFPLDKLTDERYDEMFEDVDEGGAETNDDEQDESESEDEPLSEYPALSLVSEPVIEAATSESYVKKVTRSSPEDRQEILQDEIEQQRKNEIEKMEEWLKEGWKDSPALDQFSILANAMGQMPSLFLLTSIRQERSRIEAIHDAFRRMKLAPSEEKSGPSVLLNKLNSLAERHPALERPAIEAFCLDQNNRDCEYHVTKHRGQNLDGDLNECEYCGSDLFRVFTAGLDDVVRDAWMQGLLPELVVAAILNECDWVEEVIPHRMVQMDAEDGLTSSVEVDVSVHTVDDKVLFFEVTSQKDHALNRVSRKRKKFEKNGIEYDGLVQISLVDNPDMVKFGDGVVAASAFMIPGLEDPEFEENLKSEIEDL